MHLTDFSWTKSKANAHNGFSWNDFSFLFYVQSAFGIRKSALRQAFNLSRDVQASHQTWTSISVLYACSNIIFVFYHRFGFSRQSFLGGFVFSLLFTETTQLCFCFIQALDAHFAFLFHFAGFRLANIISFHHFYLILLRIATALQRTITSNFEHLYSF